MSSNLEEQSHSELAITFKTLSIDNKVSMCTLLSYEKASLVFITISFVFCLFSQLILNKNPVIDLFGTIKKCSTLSWTVLGVTQFVCLIMSITAFSLNLIRYDNKLDSYGGKLPHPPS